jgi:hypothetical protein
MKDRDFKRVPATTGWGVEKFAQLFGFHSEKDSLSAVFDVGSDKNLLFGSGGMLSHGIKAKEFLHCCFHTTERLRALLTGPTRTLYTIIIMIYNHHAASPSSLSTTASECHSVTWTAQAPSGRPSAAPGQSRAIKQT